MGARPTVLALGLGWFPDQAGGANRYLRSWLEEYGPGARAVVVGPASDAPPAVSVVATNDAPLPWRVARYARAVRAALRGTGATTERVDVVDAHFALYAAVPVRFGLLGARPLVFHFHGPWADEARLAGSRSRVAHGVRTAIERSVYRRADAVVTLSDAFAARLVDSFGVDPARVHVIPPGVAAQFAPGDRTAARRHLDLPPDAYVVATARRLVARTGVATLVAAADRLGRVARPGPPPLVVVAGTGPEAPALQATVAAQGAPVRFLGAVADADLVALYRAADVVVVPSHALEGFGLVVLEALACGTPVVASDLDGLAEVLTPLAPDLLVPPGDATALAGRLDDARTGRRPLPDPTACRAYAGRFTWSAAVAAHRALYAGLVAPDDQGPVRVVHVDHTAVRSGGEVALVRLVAALAGTGVVAPHAVLFEDGPLVEDLRGAGASVEVLAFAERTRTLDRSRTAAGRVPLRAGFDTGVAVVRLARRLRALGPDVVHANSLKAGVVAGLAGRIAGVPVVWHLRDRLADEYLPPSTVRALRWWIPRVATAVVANSASTLATVRAPAGIRAVAIPDPYRPPARTAADVTGPAPAAVGGLRVGMVGRVAPWKGQDVFVEAFARAFPDGGATAVVAGAPLFGEEGYAAGVRRRAHELGVADRVEFRGWVDDVPGLLAGLDVLVHASVIPEPHGQVVVEGMAAGLAVIATGAGGPAEIVTPEVDGILVPPGSAEALAAALRRLAGDPVLRARLGEAARTRAGDFAPEPIAARWVDLYRSVSRGARGRVR